ncbi:MAG TPA: amidohydrolase, partial [Salinimicrobium sp.]|nr:amidohydrolase [Salinimicrobium sp.]
MLEIRKYLHQFPELSGKERATSAFISEKLREFGASKIHRNFSEHSIIAEYDFGKPGKTVLFRCELDALPIQEINSFSHKSVKKQVSHKCGHDGHMVIMLGLAKKLFSAKLPGKVLLLFQSAEENGNGARAILRSKKLKEFDIDVIFALHNIPGHAMGDVLCKPGNFTPSVESLDINLYGKTSHAGMPENGINPAGCVSEMIRYFGKLHHPEKEAKNFFLSTPIQIKMGKPAYGISAGKAVVSYTFRTWEKTFFVQKKREIISGLEQLLKKYSKLEYDL